MQSARLLSLARALAAAGHDPTKRRLITERLEELAAELELAEAVAVPPHLRMPSPPIPGVIRLADHRNRVRG